MSVMDTNSRKCLKKINNKSEGRRNCLFIYWAFLQWLSQKTQKPHESSEVI